VSLISGIFNSTATEVTESGLVRGNKAVDASFLAKIFSSFFKNGIFLDEKGGGFFTKPLGGNLGTMDAMSVLTEAGACHINGYFAYDSVQEVRRFNISSSVRTVAKVYRLDLVDGSITTDWYECTRSDGKLITKDTREKLPVRSATIFDLVTAVIEIPAGARRITEAMLTDLRSDAEMCGIVAGAVTGFDSEAWCVQMRAYLAELKQAVADLPSDSAAYFALNKLNTDLSNLSEDADLSALGIIAQGHTHTAGSIGGGTLGEDVVAASGGDLSIPRLRNISYADTAAETIADGDLMGVYL